MELGGKWPVSIVATPDVAAGARLWKTAGSHRLTIVVKATFTPVHQQPMQPSPPEPIVVDDAHVEGDAARSVLAPSDLAPYLPRGEVLYVGRARSAEGAVPALSVRLGVYGPRPLVEKTLHVVGPRTLGDHGANAPEPFVDLPITYEHALRGAMDENPAGLVPAPGGAMPTVLDPDDATGPAGYGPISSRWPGRRRLLRQLDPALLEAAVPELPDAFAWSYFHAAPPDQRCTFFSGDEWVVLDHLWRGLSRLESRLPGARAGARVYDGGAHVDVPLMADTLFIDGHREVVSLVWRGNVAVDPARLGAMEVLAGLELPGRPIPWPGSPSSPRVDAAPAPAVSAPAPLPEAAYAAQPPARGSGTHAAVTPDPPAAAASLAATTMSAPDPRPPSSPPTPAPHVRKPSGMHAAVGEPRASTPSYGIRYPTPTPGSQPALRHPTPPPMSPPVMAPPPAAPPLDDDGGHTVMRQVDARLLEQLAGDGPTTLGRAATPEGSRPAVPMAPGADEERNESTALFSLATDTTLMRIARGEAPSPISQEHPTADAEAAIDALLADPRAVPSRGPAPSQAHTARRPTGDHELVDEQTFVHDDDELQRLLHDSAAASSRGSQPGLDPAAPAPAAPAEEPVPATMAAPTTAPHPDAALRRAMRATSRGLGPVHVVEANAVQASGHGAPALGEGVAPSSLAATRTSAPSGLGDTHQARGSLAAALREELVRRIASGQPLDGANLERAELGDLDLRGQSLVGAILRGARLERAQLDGADLTGAKLDDAQLVGAQLTGAKLVGAVLDGAVLDGASLLSAQLDDASLNGASLVGAVLVDASATRASFREAELRDARLDRSQLTGADFERARLANTSFLACNLSEASFFEATLTSASFVEATLTGARFDRSSCALAKFARAAASDTLWNEAVLDGASFEAASLAGATFAKASCQGAVFSSAELAEARFQRARLDNAIFTGADLQGAVFDSPDGPPPSPLSGPLGGPASGPHGGPGDR